MRWKQVPVKSPAERAADRAHFYAKLAIGFALVGVIANILAMYLRMSGK